MLCARASHVNVIQFTKTNVTGTQVRYGKKERKEKKSDEQRRESEKKRKMLSKGFRCACRVTLR